MVHTLWMGIFIGHMGNYINGFGGVNFEFGVWEASIED